MRNRFIVRPSGVLLSCVTLTMAGCMAAPMAPAAAPRIPAQEYSRTVRNAPSTSRYNPSSKASAAASGFSSPVRNAAASSTRDTGAGSATNYSMQDRASLRYVKDYPPEERGYDSYRGPAPSPRYDDRGGADYQMYRSGRDPLEANYRSPLPLGDPGVSASLWQESRAGNDLFRDHRAFQPMDLVTIIIAETSEGKKEADTEVGHESSLLFGIANLFGYEQDIEASNSGVDTENLLTGTSTSEFTAEGETTRKGSLKARISAMVVEVLPSGVLRIEGEKILSVNNEEQVMVISGLVRQRDITAANEVDSSRVANLRVDYFGRGTVGEAQAGGWMSRLMRRFWPF